MNHRKLNRIIAAVMFLAAEIVFFSTMAPTFSFWDCGEVIATSRTLGIPHPPGAPLFLLIGHLFSQIPLFHDIGARINLVSTLESSATVMLVYLIIVRLITIYRGSDPDKWSVPEMISAYGGAVVGGFALAFSDSFWFNAVETGLWAASSFITATIVWMMLCWYEEDPAPGSERWLLAVMYMFGLSIGVHLLCLLALFALVLLYYFKKYEVNLRSFSLMVLFSLALFFLIYRGIIKELPVLLVRTSWWGVGTLVILLVIGIHYSHRSRQVLLNLGLMSVLLLVLGYTSYMLIFVRAHAGPPINENNPSTLDAFFSYVNREQYGEWPLWPRRWSPEPVHQYFYEKYSSDLEYFFSYQLSHMYLRYFGWQFIGRSADIEGAIVDWSRLWGLPFLVGVAGAAAHFRRHWKTAMVVSALFVMTGLVLVLYLNQTEPQPRERDYSYVGSFFAFALWIGIGIESLFTSLAEKMKSGDLRRNTWVAIGVVAAGLFLIDGRMLLANYRTHDRSGNYVPWDWAWNILQSCEKDAILFTNGDNDTFPLWYLQEVERIRTDVRVVNLSLANTGWYLLQLKHESPRGAKPISFTMSDADLAGVTYMPVDSIDVAVSAGIEQRKLLQDARRSGVSLPSSPSDSLRWRLRPGITYKGDTYLRPQDIAVFEIVAANYGQRPIYFALTVDPEGMIGLDKQLRLDGLVYKVVPLTSRTPMSFVDPATLYGNLFRTYRYRNSSTPGVNIEETSRNMLGNYPPLFVRLAMELSSSPEDTVSLPAPSGAPVEKQRGQLALQVLDRSGALFPLQRYPVNPQLAGSAVSIYSSLGAKEKAYPYIHYLELVAAESDVRQDPELFYTLARAYRSAGRDREAAVVMEGLKKALPAMRKQLDSLKQ
ncbi:MAG: DUF2723 domain-containing protein [Chlorobiaceae bacterium]|nr:DUF2723 domain-containing protein [Chlorobiaceae bacterium]